MRYLFILFLAGLLYSCGVTEGTTVIRVSDPYYYGNYYDPYYSGHYAPYYRPVYRQSVHYHYHDSKPSTNVKRETPNRRSTSNRTYTRSSDRKSSTNRGTSSSYNRRSSTKRNR